MKAKRSRWRDGGPPNHEIKNTKYPTGRSQDSTCSKFTDWIVFTGAKIKKRSLKKKSLPGELEEEDFAGCASIHKPRRCELHEPFQLRLITHL